MQYNILYIFTTSTELEITYLSKLNGIRTPRFITEILQKKVNMFIECIQKPKQGWRETIYNMRSIDLKTR